jgi:NhaP-type Na+/H+ or K+/H+ antiporter
MAFLGGAGLGIAWGWLLGLRDSQARKPLFNILAASAATLLLAALVFLLTDGRAAVAFLAATLLAFLLHRGWRQELAARAGPTDSQGGSS